MNRKLFLNTVLPILRQIISIVCGMILPALIITHYGSEVNGLVSSIAQFLAVIGFLELGLGRVIQYNLYQPLATDDRAQISRVVVSANRFFRCLALLLLVYVLLLMIFYPMLAGQNFGHLYTALLIACMCISSFAQYYFGQVNQLLISADQRAYINDLLQTGAVIFNTIACIVLILCGFGIHAVKLTTSLIYLVRPLVLQWYVNKHYRIDRKITYTEEPIKQKWNGLAQHISTVVLDGTDMIVLTVFSTLENVSVYSAYHMVVYHVKMLLIYATGGIEVALGNLIARGEKEELEKKFAMSEWVIHTVTILIFGCTCVLLVPFVSVYTKGVTDADYIVPLFAFLITMAHAGHCLRIPYNMMILGAGHYRQTQHNYLFAAGLNIVLSVILVMAWGLIGVAIGTLAAMIFQTIWMAWYCGKHILQRSIWKFVRQLAVDIVSMVLIVLCTSPLSLSAPTYGAWVWMSIPCVLIALVPVCLINGICYRENFLSVCRTGKALVHRVLGVRK